MPDITHEINPKLVAQMLAFLDATNILTAMNKDNFASLYEGFTMLAENYKIDLKDVENADTKSNMQKCARELLLQTQIIKENGYGGYEIRNRQEYADIVYIAKFQYENAKAASIMLDLSEKIPVSKMLKTFELGDKLGKTISDALKGTAAFTKSDRMKDFTAALLKRSGLEDKTAADLYDKAQSIANTAAKKAQERKDYINGVTEKDPVYDLIGEKQDEKREQRMARTLGIDERIDRLFDVQDEGFRRALKDARELITRETLDMMQGILDIDKELRPGEPEFTIDNVSDNTRKSLASLKNSWFISIVNCSRIFTGEIAVSLRQNLADRIKTLAERKKDDSLSPKKREIIIKKMEFLLAGEGAVKRFYDKYAGLHGMSNMQMKIIDSSILEATGKQNLTARERGKQFALILSEQNLFRCGISDNIPGWLKAMHIGPEESAWALAYAKEYGYATKEGIRWDPINREANVEKTFRSYIKTLPDRNPKNTKKFDIQFGKLKDEFIADHRTKVGKVAVLRKDAGLPPLNYKSHFNKMYDNAKMKPEYRYHVVGFTEYKSSYSVEDAFAENKKNLDAIVVQKNDAITLLDKNESRAVSALLGNGGYASRISANEHPVVHTIDSGKEITAKSMEYCWSGMRTQEILEHFKRPEDKARIFAAVNECIQNGYQYEVKNNVVKLTDPDGKHSFLADPYNKPQNGIAPCTSRYCQEFREELVGRLIDEHNLSGICRLLEKDQRKLYDSPVYRYIKHAYKDDIKEYGQIQSEVRQMPIGVILNQKERENAYSRLSARMQQLDAKQIERNHLDFHGRINEIQVIKQKDPLLAVCKIAGADGTRMTDYIIAKTEDGGAVLLSDNGKVGMEIRTEESKALIADVLDILDDPSVMKWLGESMEVSGPDHRFDHNHIDCQER